MAKTRLKAPFPAFGGKYSVANTIWERLGDVDNYIEPFCFSAAVLLARPETHVGRYETISDINHYVANFWRATSHDPEAVAEYADNPVNECDMHARHHYLTLSDDAVEFRQRVRSDPEYYNTKFAGWWCWGACCWIAGGWCTPHGETIDGERKECLPLLAQRGQGVTKQGPLKGSRPQLADSRDIGRGVNSNCRRVSCDDRHEWLIQWFCQLRDRLRLVRVCCGDWTRICSSHSTTTLLGTVGMFLDPPYAMNEKRMQSWIESIRNSGELPEPSAPSNRSGGLYSSDNTDVDKVVAQVQLYCLERGSDRRYRIVLAGYAGEHEALEAAGWSVISWKANGGYGNRSETGKANSRKERLWISPHCLKPKQGSLFD